MRRASLLFIQVSLFLLLLLAGARAGAADWPQFLGPQRNGTAATAEPVLPDVFPSELEVLWKKSVGSGFSGPVVAGGRLVVFHREGGDMVTEAVDAQTGKVLWRSSYVTDYVDSFGFDNGPRAVPAVAGGRVFTHGPEGRVTALDFATGKELWVFDTASAVGSEQGFFGRAPSPLVVGKRVIIAAGGTKDGKPAGLVALDAESGRLVWQGVEDQAGYASPVLTGTAEQPQVLAWMRNRVWLVAAVDGLAISSVPMRARMDASVNAATPVPCGQGRWFVSAGYGVGANVISTGESVRPVWQQDDLMDCHYSTPVFKDGHIYGFDGRQESGQTLRCIDLEGRRVRWDSPRLTGGTLLLAGDKLVVVTEGGELWIVRAVPEKFDLLHTSQILRSGHRSHAALADGVLYARDAEHLVAVKLH